MRVSVQWLEEFIGKRLEPGPLAERLTMLGVGAEEIIPLDPGIRDVVVARILRVKPHPDAPRLSICAVDAGRREPVQVVCGAPNARPGLVAPLALEGAKLPNGLTVAATSIQGVRSQAMLCSAAELRLSQEADGLMELPTSLRPGTALVEALELDDTAIELDITPNRPDCLSIVGVARELATLERLPLRVPTPRVQEEGRPIADVTSVEVLDPALCPRYAARVVLGVRVEPSPLWIQKRLRAVGLRPISNVVDVTNYALMELGHPLHAFDLDRLGGRRIVVRRARDGETLTTLDGESHNLTTETLVIADAKKPVALAGIMGGSDAEVTSETRNVLLESAYFNPVSIRSTAKALGVHTEASHRFERGADVGGVVRALDRAAELLQDIAGGEVCSGVLDLYPRPVEPLVVHLRPQRANALLGTDIAAEEMQAILTGLGCHVEKGPPLGVTVPTYRPDLTREVDLIEEIARVHGYDDIPTTLPTGAIASAALDPDLQRRRAIHQVMLSCGLHEACNYAFYSPGSLDRIRIPQGHPLRDEVVIANPMSAEASVLRTSLLPSLLHNVRHNRRHQVEHVALYELARVFLSRGARELPTEKWVVAGAVCGHYPAHWSSSAREPDFYDAKGVVEALLRAAGLREWSLERTDHPTFHPGRSARTLWNGHVLATLGEAHPEVLRNNDIDRRVVLFEVDADALCAHWRPDRWMEALPPFPSTKRDLSFLVDKRWPAADITDTIRGAIRGLLGSVLLFDVYTGEQVPSGKKSLAYSLEYRSAERTLTDSEVDRMQAQIVRLLEERFGAELRT
jgi:phenylalanyl-tRNA synthetase beta chain